MGNVCNKLCLLSMASALIGTVGAVPRYDGAVPAQEVRVRSGVGHVLKKIADGKSVKIGYFGGSITSMVGWRSLSLNWFRGTYPGNSFSEIPAAIGGTGSELGVYRYENDVLRQKPDLVFVEFATNDKSLTEGDIWKNFDGIVRKTWRADPETDIVFVYTITKADVEEYAAGACTRTASAMEMLADYYGIPSICFGPRVAADVKSGKLVMTVPGEIETAVPSETPDRDQAIIDALAKEGKVLFSKDGTHPVSTGHAYYLTSVTNAWAQMLDIAPVDHAQKLSAAYYDPSREGARQVTVTSDMLTGTWTPVGSDDPNSGFSSKFGATPWLTETAGSKLKFQFRGTECKIYDLMGPACGQVWITVDGVRRGPVARFDSYCTYYRLNYLSVFSGEDGDHDIEIELDADQPSRQSIAFRLQDPVSELASPTYSGIKWYVGGLLLVSKGEPAPAVRDRKSWFDANIIQYANWPEDAVLADGGTWRNGASGTLPLTDGVTLETQGALALETKEDLRFVATAKKDPTTFETATVTADLEFGDYMPDYLPEIDPSYKAGVISVVEHDIVHYYGIAKVEGTNRWVKLSGPVVDHAGKLVKLVMTMKRNGREVTVCYNLDGNVYSYNGLADIPVVAVGEIAGASLRGNGTIRSLSGRCLTPTGMAVIVR